MSDQGGEPKPSRRKRTPASDESQTDGEPKRQRKTEGDIPVSATDSEEAPRPRRRVAKPAPDADVKPPAEKSSDEAKTRTKRKAAEPSEKPKPAESRPAGTGKSEKPAPKKPTPREPFPKGRIARAIWIARMVIRYAPAWGVIVILLMLFGPRIYRSIFPPVIPPVAPLFRPEVRYWTPQITRWAQEYNVSANLIATLMQIESCGYPGAASVVGAQGLFQVMPSNFQEEDQPKMTDPETNAKAGIQVIKDCLRYAEGDVGLAMACYNGGPRLIYVNPVDWPTETQHYYTWGGGIYNDAIRNASKSDTLDQWLDAGGINLCERAAGALGLGVDSTINPPVTNPTPANTPIPVLPTLEVVQPGQAQITTVPGSLPTYAMPTNTPSVKLYLTPKS